MLNEAEGLVKPEEKGLKTTNRQGNVMIRQRRTKMG